MLCYQGLEEEEVVHGSGEVCHMQSTPYMQLFFIIDSLTDNRLDNEPSAWLVAPSSVESTSETGCMLHLIVVR